MWGLRCLRCGHEWVPRGVEQPADGKPPPEPKDPPRICPKCKSAYFDKPKDTGDDAPGGASKTKPRRKR